MYEGIHAVWSGWWHWPYSQICTGPKRLHCALLGITAAWGLSLSLTGLRVGCVLSSALHMTVTGRTVPSIAYKPVAGPPQHASDFTSSVSEFLPIRVQPPSYFFRFKNTAVYIYNPRIAIQSQPGLHDKTNQQTKNKKTVNRQKSSPCDTGTLEHDVVAQSHGVVTLKAVQAGKL